VVGVIKISYFIKLLASSPVIFIYITEAILLIEFTINPIKVYTLTAIIVLLEVGNNFFFKINILFTPKTNFLIIGVNYIYSL